MYLRFPALVAAFGALVVAIVTASATAALAYIALLGTLAVLDALLAPSPRRVHVERIAPTSVRLGHSAEVAYSVSSERRIVGEFRDAWPPSAGVAPSRHTFDTQGGSDSASATMSPRRRGTLRSSALTIRTRGPFRLAGRQRTFPTAWSLLTTPAFHSASALPQRVRKLRELDGRALLLQRGEGTEFDSLREYVAGDDVRAIDWRSTARLGTAVVRTWLPERDRRILVVLDAGRALSLRSGNAPLFDAAIETALLMSAVAAKAGDSLTVLALDHLVRARASVSHSANPIFDVGAALADVEPSSLATSLQPALAVARSIRASLIVVVTDPATIEPEQFAALRTLAPVIVANPQIDNLENSLEPVWNAYLRAADARDRLTQSGYATQLSHGGIRVITAYTHDLPAKTADAYLCLKAAGQL
ncbi:uncharacterized protein (DUF58 family) [Arcanobacterium wilhelmae]|uniref:Uncharacterized protein (DUF58 family) n=1 Tax=Arcanobacterium wilhelmae TaxID=1803177 RepID=A0ABT9NCA7_9ACTO|nr:DUF58 domain-containing protein [Arcanobacterium wilhelmae]MDP9801353.1 uncharacterized protein (DUF58 family) [Arcanobacterium wilhelmae]WFN90690.1 DUF58 domain-containing protein [Arcanobacterium wilhelmae]